MCVAGSVPTLCCYAWCADNSLPPIIAADSTKRITHTLTQNGSHEQKLRFLPDACSGAKVGGMCMSEPGAGTDVLGMRTTATKSTGDGGAFYTLNGAKMWITNGTLDGRETGDVYLVYARTGGWGLGLSLCVVGVRYDHRGLSWCHSSEGASPSITHSEVNRPPLTPIIAQQNKRN